MSHSVRSASFIHRPTALAIAFAVCQVSTGVVAQEGPILEEILITAQKRVESLQEVPISVSAVTGDKLDEAGIENLEDLTAHLPNIHFTETGFSTQVRVRGIGSDNSQGFEQSVGMYIDGIYYGRAQLFRAPMMDMERAELLRGPQSTLFGKNSIAGALNLTSAKPKDELEGKLAVSLGDEYGEQEVNAVISGPLHETFRARLAVREYEDDGYMYNTFTRTEQPSTDESAVRLSMEWDTTDDLSFFLKAERNTFEVLGRPIEITQDISLLSGGPSYSDTLRALSQPGFDPNQDYLRQADAAEFSDNEVNNLTLVADYEMENMTLTSVTGSLDYDYTERCDCDFTAAELLDLELDETYDQFSQEFRLSSATGGALEWIGGVFYQKYDQEFSDTIPLLDTNLLPQLQPALAVLADSRSRRDFEQSSKASAIFGQATYNLLPELHLTVGARYTKETKEATKAITLRDASGNTIVDPVRAATLGQTYLAVFRLESDLSPGGGHDVAGKRDESAFTPMINLQYDATDDMMLYASFTKGFKAGGFDPRSNSVGTFGPVPIGDVNPLNNFEFEEEKADAFELGMKTSLADGRGELNLAIYRTNYFDLQISQFDGGVGFNVGNAKETVVRGLEVDGRWALLDRLTLSYGISYLDFEYKNFRNGNCYEGQTPNGIDSDGDSIVDTCDYTGKRGVYSPELTLNASLDYSYPITGNLDIVGFVDVQHVDEQQVHVNLDPLGEIDAYTMLGMRVGINADKWSVAILGKNLLDEQVISYSANAPLAGSLFNTNTFYSFVRKPRTIALEGTIRF